MTKATLAPILKKEDGQIDFHRSAQEIFNRLRGFQPWPGAFTAFAGRMYTYGQRKWENALWRKEKSLLKTAICWWDAGWNCPGVARVAGGGKEAHPGN